jgi:hypothetical protein
MSIDLILIAIHPVPPVTGSASITALDSLQRNSVSTERQQEMDNLIPPHQRTGLGVVARITYSIF